MTLALLQDRRRQNQRTQASNTIGAVAGDAVVLVNARAAHLADGEAAADIVAAEMAGNRIPDPDGCTGIARRSHMPHVAPTMRQTNTTAVIGQW